MGLFDNLFKTKPEAADEAVVEAAKRIAETEKARLLEAAKSSASPPAPRTGAVPASKPGAVPPPRAYSPRSLGQVVTPGRPSAVSGKPGDAKPSSIRRIKMSGTDAAGSRPSEVVLRLEDVLPRIPVDLLADGTPDLRRELRFKVDDLSADIARGRAAVPLTRIASQMPELFREPVSESDTRLIRLPLQKLVEQIGFLPTKSLPQTAPAPFTPAPTFGALPPASAPASAPVPPLPPVAKRPSTIIPPPPGPGPSLPLPLAPAPAEPAPELAPRLETVPAPEPTPLTPPPLPIPAIEPDPKASVDAELTSKAEPALGSRISLRLSEVLRRCPKELIVGELPVVSPDERISFAWPPIEKQLASGTVEISSVRFIFALPAHLQAYFEAREGVRVPLPLEEIQRNVPRPGDSVPSTDSAPLPSSDAPARPSKAFSVDIVSPPDETTPDPSAEQVEIPGEIFARRKSPEPPPADSEKPTRKRSVSPFLGDDEDIPAAVFVRRKPAPPPEPVAADEPAVPVPSSELPPAVEPQPEVEAKASELAPPAPEPAETASEVPASPAAEVASAPAPISEPLPEPEPVPAALQEPLPAPALTEPLLASEGVTESEPEPATTSVVEAEAEAPPILDPAPALAPAHPEPVADESAPSSVAPEAEAIPPAEPALSTPQVKATSEPQAAALVAEPAVEFAPLVSALAAVPPPAPEAAPTVEVEPAPKSEAASEPAPVADVAPLLEPTPPVEQPEPAAELPPAPPESTESIAPTPAVEPPVHPHLTLPPQILAPVSPSFPLLPVSAPLTPAEPVAAPAPEETPEAIAAADASAKPAAGLTVPPPIFMPPPLRQAGDSLAPELPAPSAPIEAPLGLESTLVPPNVWMQPPPELASRPPAPWPPDVAPPPSPILPVRIVSPPVLRPMVAPPPLFGSGPEESTHFHVDVPAPEPVAPPPPVPLDLTVARSVFELSDEASLPEIGALLVRQPGITACLLAARHETGHSGTFPEGFDAEAALALGRQITGALAEHAEKLGVTAVQHTTVFTEAGCLTFLSQREAVVCVLHATRSFLPGVREKLALAASALSEA